MDTFKRFAVTLALVLGVCGYTSFASSLHLSSPGYSLVSDDTGAAEAESENESKDPEQVREEKGREGEAAPGI